VTPERLLHILERNALDTLVKEGRYDISDTDIDREIESALARLFTVNTPATD
jgi:hypothetical protein